MARLEYWMCNKCGDYFGMSKPCILVDFQPKEIGPEANISFVVEAYLCPPCAKQVLSFMREDAKPTGWQPKHHG